MAGGFEFVEHTADVGIRAWGPSLAETFEQVAAGVVELMDVRVEASRSCRRRSISLTSTDAGALLVGFVNELVFVCDEEAAGIVDVHVGLASDTSVVAELVLAERDDEPHGLDVKAATYHQLAVDRREDGNVEARVFVDV